MLTFGCSDGWRAVCAHSALLSVCVHVSTGLVGPGPSLGLAPARAGADLRLQQRFSLRCIIQLTRGQTTGHCVSLEGGGASDNIIMEAGSVWPEVTDHNCRDVAGESDMSWDMTWAPRGDVSVVTSEFSAVHASMFIMHWTIDEHLLHVTARLSRAQSTAELPSLENYVSTQAALQGSFNRWAGWCDQAVHVIEYNIDNSHFIEKRIRRK